MYGLILEQSGLFVPPLMHLMETLGLKDTISGHNAENSGAESQTQVNMHF